VIKISEDPPSLAKPTRSLGNVLQTQNAFTLGLVRQFSGYDDMKIKQFEDEQNFRKFRSNGIFM